MRDALYELCICGDTAVNHGVSGECLVKLDTKNRDGCMKFIAAEDQPEHTGRAFARRQRELRKEWKQPR